MATKISAKHDKAKRKNIPLAEQQSFVQKEPENPKQIRYPRNTRPGPTIGLKWQGCE